MNEKESRLLIEQLADLVVHLLNKMRVPAGKLGDSRLDADIKLAINTFIRIRDNAAKGASND